MTAVVAVEPTLLRGVSLAGYAGVQAGLAEGIDIAVVLEREAIDPAAWPEAEAAWSDRLMDDLAVGGTLQEEYDRLMGEAQDRYGRPVPPLDQNLRSWLDFVRRWSADPEPLASLWRLGLRPQDLMRLQRLWSSRMQMDPALMLEAQTILGGEPGELPVPVPGEIELASPPKRAPHEVAASSEVQREEHVDASGEDAIELPVPPMFTAMPATLNDGDELVGGGSAGASPGAQDTLTDDEPSRGDNAPPRTLDPAELPVVSGPVLPFRSTEESPEQDPDEAPTLRRRLEGPGADLDPRPGVTTAPLPMLITIGPPLPFLSAIPGVSPAVPPPGSLEPTPVAIPTFGPPPAPTQGRMPAVPAVVPALPFRAVPEVSPALTLSEYASLCAELAVSPDAAESIFHRYGLSSAETRLAVDAHWKARLRDNPTEHLEWQALYSSFHADWAKLARKR